MAKRGFLRLKISTDCPYFTILIVSLFYVVRSYFIWSFAPRCRLLLWWKLLLTADDISPTYNHFWAYPVFCLGRERFCFSTRYPCRTERPPAAQFQICRTEILFSSGRVARKRRERSLNCTAESFNSTFLDTKKVADIFIPPTWYLSNIIP